MAHHARALGPWQSAATPVPSGYGIRKILTLR
jgi:hypothetical protein